MVGPDRRTEDGMSKPEIPESVQAEPIQEVDAFDRRGMMSKLVAAAALAATGIVNGEASTQAQSPRLAGENRAQKVEKWNESYKIFKDSAIRLLKMQTGFRVEILATPELGATLRSMGLVPNTEGGPVKVSIEFSNT